jgi:1-deoxy-D-xylulose-5-phosphate reductoisomerase
MEPASAGFVNTDMQAKNLAILGSTGSIGRSTMDVLDRHPGAFQVRALAAHSDIDRLEKQYRKYLPEFLCVVDQTRGAELKDRLQEEKVTVLIGEDELLRVPALDEIDIVLNAVVGAAGLRASLQTVKHGRRLALANKESLVVGGPLFPDLCEKHNASIFPIDSEHSAIWQVLRRAHHNELKKIILTSSGGPFRNLPADKFETITVEQALNHPTWDMGPKITIDSATMANKGLEVIEAVWLFSVSVDQIEVIVHPESIVHSMVEFMDSSILAQMSLPDMRLPITHALFWPDRVESEFGHLDWREVSSLSFEPPNLEKFRALKLAFDAAAAGGTAPAIYNAANEIAVQSFLEKQVKFNDIGSIIEDALNSVEIENKPDLESILAADDSARARARRLMEKLT